MFTILRKLTEPPKFSRKPISIEELEKVKEIVELLNKLLLNECDETQKVGVIDSLIERKFADELSKVKDYKTKIYLLHTIVTLNEPRLIGEIIPLITKEYKLYKLTEASFLKEGRKTLVEAISRTEYVDTKIIDHKLRKDVRMNSAGDVCADEGKTALRLIPFLEMRINDDVDFRKNMAVVIFSCNPIVMNQLLNEENLKNYFALLDRGDLDESEKTLAIRRILAFGDASTKKILADIAEKDAGIQKIVTEESDFSDDKRRESSISSGQSVKELATQASLLSSKSVEGIKGALRKLASTRGDNDKHILKQLLHQANFEEKIRLAPLPDQVELIHLLLPLDETNLEFMMPSVFLDHLNRLLEENDDIPKESFENLIESILENPIRKDLRSVLIKVIKESGQTYIDIYLLRAKTKGDDAFNAAMGKIMSSRWKAVKRYIAKKEPTKSETITKNKHNIGKAEEGSLEHAVQEVEAKEGRQSKDFQEAIGNVIKNKSPELMDKVLTMERIEAYFESISHSTTLGSMKKLIDRHGSEGLKTRIDEYRIAHNKKPLFGEKVESMQAIGKKVASIPKDPLAGSKRPRSEENKASAMNPSKRARKNVSGEEKVEGSAGGGDINPDLLSNAYGFRLLPKLDGTKPSGADADKFPDLPSAGCGVSPTHSMGDDAHSVYGAHAFFDPWDVALNTDKDLHGDIIPDLLSNNDDGFRLPELSATKPSGEDTAEFFGLPAPGCGVSPTASIASAFFGTEGVSRTTPRTSRYLMDNKLAVIVDTLGDLTN